MNDMLNLLKEHLTQYRKELEDVIDKLTPLERQKQLLGQKIEIIESLISLEEDHETKENNSQDDRAEGEIPSQPLPLSGKSGQEAYKILIDNDLKDSEFKERDIRKLANEKGLQINDSFITGSYSRALLNRMVERGDIIRVKKGLFSTITPKAIMESSEL